MEKDIETKTTRDIGKDWNYSSNNHTERANKKMPKMWMECKVLV